MLFTLVLVMAGVGIAMSYSASAVYALKTFGDSFYFLKRQLLWLVAGLVSLLCVQNMDYRVYRRHTRVMLAVALVLLALVLVPGLGHSVKGSSRWLSFGLLHLQPSEFVKVVLVIYLVKVFSAEHRGTVTQVFQMLVPMLVIALMFMLIMLQPDFGTAITMLVVSVFILFVSGFPLLYLLMLFVIEHPHVLPAHLPGELPVGAHTGLPQSMGGPFRHRLSHHPVVHRVQEGRIVRGGPRQRHAEGGKAPEPHTDFIYAVIAEETGLLGTLLVVGLFCFFLWRGIRISLAAPDEFGRLLAAGIALMVVVQAFINIGVVTGSLPTTGIPLPFISYGGSSLLASMIGLGNSIEHIAVPRGGRRRS